MKAQRVVYLAGAVLLAPAAYWLASDRSVWLWDQSWYGEVSTDLWFLAHHSLRQWGGEMLYGMKLKPPGLVWIGQFFVPLRALLGSVENALLLEVLITQALLLWLIYKIGEALRPAHRWAPLVGVFFAAATQAFTGLSHQLMAEPLQAVAVAWVALAAAKTGDWPAPRILLHLAAATLLGLLAKLTTPAYCVLFYAYIGFTIKNSYNIGWRQEFARNSSRLLSLVFIVLFPLTALWYALNANQVWQHARDSAFGAVALTYGFRSSFGGKLLTWSGLLGQTLLSPYLLWVLALALGAGAAGYARNRDPAGRSPGILVLSLAQIAFMLLAFSAADAVVDRYLYPLIVYLALAVTLLCARLRRGVFVLILLGLCSAQWFLVNAAASGFRVDLRRPSPLLVAAHPERSEYEEMTRLVQLTSDAPGRFNIVGVDDARLNANAASFFAAQRRLDTGVRSYYTSLGYSETDVRAALKRLEDFHVHYFITLDQAHLRPAPDFLNAVSAPVLRAVSQDPRYRPVAFPSVRGVLVFERQDTEP